MITSKDNEIFKLANKVKDKKYSKLHNLCLVETIKIIKELYNKNLVTHILVREDKFHLVKDFTSVRLDIISDNLCNSLSDAMTNDGVFAICSIPPSNDIDYSKCLILDGLQDPANIGAIIRSACAFGYNTIFAINSVYPYTFKCIRSSMGHIFNINYIDITYENLLEIKKNYDITIITADMHGTNIDNVKKDFRNYAIAIGNEGNGVSDKITELSDLIVSIPMGNDVESLNASVSAGILMYLLK